MWTALATAGQGGNDLLGNKQQIADQAEKYGNAALVSTFAYAASEPCIPHQPLQHIQ